MEKKSFLDLNSKINSKKDIQDFCEKNGKIFTIFFKK